jgi:proline utilization trans-activator
MTGAPSYNTSRLKANIVSIVLYGSTLQTEDTFISNVQSIIRSLYDISDEIPLELATGMPKLGNDLTLRTSAALHLMFYQVCFQPPFLLQMPQVVNSYRLSC